MTGVADLLVPACGDSDLLRYLEANTAWIERIAPAERGHRPHACFVNFGLFDAAQGEAGAASSHHVPRLLGEYRAALGANDRYSLVLDYSPEGPGFSGHTAGHFAALHALLQRLDIPPQRVTLLQSGLPLLQEDGPYQGWCRRRGLRPIRIRYAHWWLLDQAAMLHRRFGAPALFAAHQDRLLAALAPGALVKTRKFLSFNYFPRLHRVALLLWLIERDLLRHGRVSFPGFRIAEVPNDFLAETLSHLRGWRAGARLAPRAAQLQTLSPLRVDSGAEATKRSLSGHFVDAPFLHTAFSVLTETGFGHGLAEWRVTEKFLKPVMHMHPFLLVGEPGGLELIRRLGFQTFAPFFDESYDSVLEPEQRLERIVDGIAAACARGLPGLLAALQPMIPVLRHNLHHAVYGLWGRMREESEYPVINHLLDDLGLPGPRLAVPCAALPVPPGVRRAVPGDAAGEQIVRLPQDVRETIRLAAAFDWAAPQESHGRRSWTLRAGPGRGNHCVLWRTGCDLSQPFRFIFEVRSQGAKTLLIQLKDPPGDRFRAVFDFEYGIFLSAHNADPYSTVSGLAHSLDDDWFRIDLAGRVGTGRGPLDIVIYLGAPDFVFDGDQPTGIELANLSLLRCGAGAVAADGPRLPAA